MDGYILKKNKDSLRGQIDYKDWNANPELIWFRDARTGTKSAFGTAELFAFGVNNERYECHTVHIRPYSVHPEILTSQEDVGNPYDTTVFLQLIVSGKMSLWEYRQQSGTNYYFVSVEQGKSDQLRLETWVSTTQGMTRFEQREVYKNQLTYLMSDCQTVQRSIARTEYNENSLRKLIFSYNNCGKDTAASREPGGRGSSVQFFPIAGYMTSRVKFGGSDDMEVSQQWPASGSLVAGAGALILLPRNRQQFSFVTDLVWQRFHSESTTTGINYFTTETGHIDYSMLQLDILFRYRYPSGKIRPFLEGGMANAAVLSMNCYETSKDLTDGTSTNEALLGGSLNHYQQGWILGAGVSGRHWSVEGGLAWL